MWPKHLLVAWRAECGSIVKKGLVHQPQPNQSCHPTSRDDSPEHRCLCSVVVEMKRKGVVRTGERDNFLARYYVGAKFKPVTWFEVLRIADRCFAHLFSDRRLTFDMGGGPKGAKRPLERPLDGGLGLLLRSMAL